MGFVKKILNIFLFSWCLLSQSQFIELQSNSVSESEGLNAFYNPAGFGIDNGWENFLYGSFDKNHDINKGTLFLGDRFYGFGYYVGYNKTDKFNSPSEFSFSLGNKIANNLYIGISYNQDKIYKLGSIFRPYNFISNGLSFDSNDNVIAGLAIRPFLKHKVTIGLEYFVNLETEHNDFMGYLKIMDIKGLDIMSQYKPDMEHLSLEIGLNFSDFRLQTNYKSDNSNMINFGLSKSTKKRNSVTDKNEKKYIKLNLNHTFIEESPRKSKFNFGLSNEISFPFINEQKQKPVQLRKFLKKINNLSEDESIDGMIINFKNINASFNKRSEIRDALIDFQQSGKKIIFYSEKDISNIDYHLFSIADSIYLNKLTGVDLKGLSMEITFYRGLLDSLNIVPEVYRVSRDGKSYKTAGNPFLDYSMSDELKENYNMILDDLYEQFLNDIALSRNWSISKTQNIIDNGPYWSTQDAIDNELITDSMYPDDFNNYLKKITKKRQLVDFWKINENNKYNYNWKIDKKPKIAIIYAVGGIISGKSNPGPYGSTIMGDKTIKKALQKVRKDKNLDAIILRIESGGGSALASDQIWKEISNFVDNDGNKVPFIASMSSSAASGGYYIACNADTIIAHPSTITGSIGVISMAFNLSDMYKKIGINKETIKRGDFSDLNTQSRQWTDKERQKFIDSVEDFYLEFKKRVIEGRDNLNDIDMLDDIALGRVWTGNQALDNGLIDQLGGTIKTIEIAKQMANIDVNSEVEIIEFPEEEQFNFNNLYEDSNILVDMLPQNLKDEINKFNILPILQDEKMYFMLPHHIEIK